MRAYFFGNMYLSSIQQGIQAAHAVADMFVKYDTVPGGKVSPQTNDLLEWAANHKTMVLLNAGYSDTIRSLIEVFDTHHNPYPWAEFHEEQASLDGALTTVGIILPEQVYIGAKQIREGWVEEGTILHRGYVEWDFPEHKKYDVSKWEFEMMLHLNAYGLAK